MPYLLRRLLSTEPLSAALIARLALGCVMLPHGLQKTLGAFGGEGFRGTIDGFTQMGFPVAIALLVVLAESLGSLALIVGFLTRIAAFGILNVMIGAVALVHHQHGFFMNWQQQKSGEGFEYHLLAIALALVVLLVGAGRWSIDRWLMQRLVKRRGMMR